VVEQIGRGSAGRPPAIYVQEQGLQIRGREALREDLHELRDATFSKNTIE
jgi:hypothetical protein